MLPWTVGFSARTSEKQRSGEVGVGPLTGMDHDDLFKERPPTSRGRFVCVSSQRQLLCAIRDSDDSPLRSARRSALFLFLS